MRIRRIKEKTHNGIRMRESLDTEKHSRTAEISATLSWLGSLRKGTQWWQQWLTGQHIALWATVCASKGLCVSIRHLFKNASVCISEIVHLCSYTSKGEQQLKYTHKQTTEKSWEADIWLITVNVTNHRVTEKHCVHSL